MIIKSESNFQIFHSETIASLEMGAKGQISLVQLLNGDRPIVHWSNENIFVIWICLLTFHLSTYSIHSFHFVFLFQKLGNSGFMHILCWLMMSPHVSRLLSLSDDQAASQECGYSIFIFFLFPFIYTSILQSPNDRLHFLQMHEPISLMSDNTFPNYTRPNCLQNPVLKHLSENPCAKRVESLVEVELKQGPLPPSACAVRLVPTSHHPWPPGFAGNFHCHWYCRFFFDPFTFNWRHWMGNVRCTSCIHSLERPPSFRLCKFPFHPKSLPPSFLWSYRRDGIEFPKVTAILKFFHKQLGHEGIISPLSS